MARSNPRHPSTRDALLDCIEREHAHRLVQLDAAVHIGPPPARTTSPSKARP